MANNKLVSSIAYCQRQLRKCCPEAAKLVSHALFLMISIDVETGSPVALELDVVVPERTDSADKQVERVLHALSAGNTGVSENDKMVSTCRASQTEEVTVLDTTWWTSFLENVECVGRQNETMRKTIEQANMQLKDMRWELMQVALQHQKASEERTVAEAKIAQGLAEISSLREIMSSLKAQCLNAELQVESLCSENRYWKYWVLFEKTRSP
eukprot:TRINITY_DN15050_c0_g1_i2.p1 TRINITY_DN15050_c0_g1~~TRINITY_DN15050_c0_g1_i2.p1  ORF type:complete len:238 (+),score=33.11 TRINITY_DN15050_c0_g1_i2:81-716(+)